MTDAQILVIAAHPMIGALLGALVELAGHRPRFSDAGESPEGAMERFHPDLVLLDCEHVAAADDAPYRTAFEVGSRVVLFGSSLSVVETELFAARRGVPCITLPIGYTAFSERLASLLEARPGRALDRELRDQASA